MQLLILEDETLSASRLVSLVGELEPQARVVAVLDSVEGAAEWLQTNPAPDLMLVDIHLADGSSLDLFRRVTVTAPFVFTTAYDHYAVEAFRLNGLDYLLKPIDPDELRRAFDRFRQWQHRQTPRPAFDVGQLAQTLHSLRQPYKQRFLVRFGDNLLYKATQEIAYFYADDKTVYLVADDGKRYVIDYRIEQLEDLLDPAVFFRLNRKFVARVEAIQRMKSQLNSRLQLFLKPQPDMEVYVSKERVSGFKAWLDQ
jgi:two-component system, LytTR family, response regulator LytT